MAPPAGTRKRGRRGSDRQHHFEPEVSLSLGPDPGQEAVLPGPESGPVDAGGVTHEVLELTNLPMLPWKSVHHDHPRPTSLQLVVLHPNHTMVVAARELAEDSEYKALPQGRAIT
jgi:hypothetical protein